VKYQLKRKIYSIVGNTPEVLAYGMAKYSRSNLSLERSVTELSKQKTEDFLNTFYFQYGHSSIADLAHVAIAIENISIWSAMIIVDEQLWDGQERSTRYQDFKKTKYHIPNGVVESYNVIADGMFSKYEELTEKVKLALMEKYPCPNDMEIDSYGRTLKARAFDVSRYWLPLCTRTSLGQITNARTLEKQISRLLSHDLPEIKEIAQEMKDAVVTNEPINFLLERTNQLGIVNLEEIIKTGPLLPTLAKYTRQNAQLIMTKQKLKIIADDILNGIEPEIIYGVELHHFKDPLNHACTSLLYSASKLSYKQIMNVVLNLTENNKKEILDVAFQFRGRHDAWLRELQSSPLIFDITMDIGSFRDLNRHRKVSKILQEPDIIYGYEVPQVLVELNMEAEFKNEMNIHFKDIERLKASWSQLESGYLLPLGANCRSLHQMDLQQAAYLIELRTGSAGHFSYREIAYQMFEKLNIDFPEFTKYIRVTNPREIYDPFNR
jgi:thymidylate synthase ThyX